MLNFLKNYASTTIKQAASDATAALAAFDPEGATEAQISQMEEALDTIGVKLAKTKTQHAGAQSALAAAVKLHDTRMKAAEMLSADPSKEKSLETMVKLIEDSEPEIEDLRKAEADYAIDLAALSSAYDDAANKLKTARRTLEQAHRDMDRAKLNEARAKERAETAAVAAGVHQGADTLNVALDAMKRKAKAANEAADAANMKASVLAPSKAENDPAIAAALAAASGSTVGTTMTIQERLAALKQKAA
jgi:chromosome segregation ATPase